MNDRLNVLVLESERGAADVACDELSAAGHTVLRCHEPSTPARSMAAVRMTAPVRAIDRHAGAIDVVFRD